MRLVIPGLRVLLLSEAALSKYALTGLISTIDHSLLQADVVQIVGEAGKAFPAALSGVLQLAHPAWLIITPAALSPKLRKAGATGVIAPLPSSLASTSWQVMQTAQVGTIDLNSSLGKWNLHVE